MDYISILPQASLLLGIIPALLLLYVSLKGYDGLYKDKNLYLAFLGGILSGLVVALIELNTMYAGLLIPILWIMIELLFKTAILNIPKLQQKKETVIYGLALGLGFGAMFVPFNLGTINATNLDAASIIILIVSAITYVPLHGATGVIIGHGVYRSTLKKDLITAFLILLPLVVWAVITISLNMVTLQILLLPYAFVIYWYYTTHYMPEILDENQPRKRANN